MPIYQPPPSRRSAKLEDGEGGQVLDLETAVKGGILGGDCDGTLIFSGGGLGEKSPDLAKMIEELDSIDVPSVFICPISLEPMRDPVTLSTGQTYERLNIVKWFSFGHCTCPTTMQELWDDSVTPNTTLRQLIHGWFSQKYSAMKKRSEDVHGRALEVLESLRKVKGQARVEALKSLRRLVVAHGSARKAVSDHGGVGLIASLLGNFTSHAVGAEAVGILVNLELDEDSKAALVRPTKMSLMADLLNEGSIETKVNCARLIEILINGNDFNSEIASSLSLAVGLLRLVKDKRHREGIFPGLSLLKTMCRHVAVKSSAVSVGTVPQLVELLPSLNNECLELALQVLDELSAIPEGTLALRDCPKTIPNLVRLLMNVSEKCTRLSLSILWAVCKQSPEDCPSLETEAGLAAKLLLVIQSGCDSVLKQRAAELLKLCSLNYTASIFISKCKLTRTIQ